MKRKRRVAGNQVWWFRNLLVPCYATIWKAQWVAGCHMSRWFENEYGGDQVSIS